MKAERPASVFVSRGGLMAWALALACAMSAGNAATALFRRVWQSHYPALAEQWANDGRFAAVNWFGTSVIEEIGYAARTRNASRTLLPYDPYIKEWRPPQQIVNDYLSYAALGALNRVTGDVSRTWVAAVFLCCLLWFFLIYRLMLKATGEPGFSVFCAVVVTGFSYLLTLQFASQLGGAGLKRALWTMLSYGRTEGITRLPRPGVTYAFAFLASALAVAAADKRTAPRALLAGLVGGLLAYVRVDVWTTFMVALWAFALAVSVRERRPAWQLWGAAALASAVSLPFLYYCFPPDPDLLIRNGNPGKDYRFHPYSLSYLAAAAAGLRWGKRPAVWFFAAMTLGLFVMVNINMLTGFLTAVMTWRYFGHVYVFLLLASLAPAAWVKRQALWLAASAGLVFVAFMQGVSYAALHFPFQGLPKDYQAALEWLDADAADDDELASLNPEVIGLVPAYTRLKTSLAYGVPVVSSYPMVRNAGRLVSTLRLLGADEARYLEECVLENRPYDSRGMADLGFKRGELEKTQVVPLLFSLAPESYWREALREAIRNPTPIAPRYLWFGVLERQYAPEGPPKTGRWTEVYRNPSLTLYRRGD